MDRLLEAGRGRERADKRIIGGEEHGRERFRGHVESLGQVERVETLLPRHAVGVERPAEVEEQRIDPDHHGRPIAGMG